MSRLVYLVITFLNPFGKLYVLSAAQQNAVQAQSLLWLPPAASTPANAQLWRSSSPQCPTAAMATLVSTLLHFTPVTCQPTKQHIGQVLVHLMLFTSDLSHKHALGRVGGLEASYFFSFLNLLYLNTVQHFFHCRELICLYLFKVCKSILHRGSLEAKIFEMSIGPVPFQ